MKMTRSLAAALLVALGLGAASVRAAEITLYEHDNFGGAQLTLRGYTPNFAGTGFNDRASSIVVTSGRWELCSDADFKGTCTVFGPGEYPTIDRYLTNRFSSAREIGSYGEQRGSYSEYGRGSIELFDQPEFRGQSLHLDSDAEALARSGFNDRAASVVVTKGTWELCTDADYYGDCRSFSPGRYPDLGFGMERRVSSARLIRPPREAPVVVAPGSAQSLVAGRAFLYNERGLHGTSLAVAGPVGDLQRSGFDDETKSILVESGSWLACRDTWFRGDCRIFGPGRYDDLAAIGFDRVISSIRPAEPQQPVVSASPGAPPARPFAAPEPSRGAALEFYSEPGFAGERLLLDGTMGDLDQLHFDRRAASVVVLSGTWELCTDARFSGSCAVYPPGRYPRMGGLTRQVVSVRRIQ